MYVKTQWVDNTTPINENNLNKIESGIKNNDINIGEENYDNTRTYEVGDIVRYNEKIYKCITAITTAENFDISKWEQTNIVEIVQSEKSKIYELIEAISTPIVGEGENITLNDTAEKRFENFDIEGNSEQETRSGKNKIEITKTTTTVNGCTHTIKDGTDTLSGTSTGWANLVIYSFTGNGKTYTLSGSPQSSKNIFISAHDNTQNKDLATSKNSNAGTFVATSGNSIDIIICVAPNLTLANELFKPQLEEGSTVTEWEQGGVSPSPDYPSEVECCGDNINLFDKDNANILNAFFHKDNTVIVADGNRKIIWTECKPNKNYTISLEENINIANKIALGYTTEIPKIGKQVYSISSIANNIQTINTGNDAKYLVAYVYSENYTMSFEDIINSIKIVEGTEVGEYSKYGQGCINEVICNKNLFDKNTTTDNTALNLSDGSSVTFNGRTTSDYIIVKYNTKYVFSKDGEKLKVNIVEYDKNKNFIKGYTGDAFTTSNDTRYIKFYFGTADMRKIQLEQDVIVTSYEEHQSQSYTIPTQQPMRAIGDTRDTFILKENGKWYERHYIDRKIFDGNEGITINTKDTESTLFQLVCTDCFVPTNLDKIYAKSNQLKGTSVNLCISEITGKNTVALGHNTNRLWLRVSSEIVGTGTDTERLTQLKSWLEEQYNAGTPVYVDYVLKEPLDIECTEEQTEILNQMYIKAKSYKGVTHIYSNDEVSPNCYVEAVKDLTTLIQ